MLNLLVMVASHLLSKCSGILSPYSQNLHDASATRLRFLECFFSWQRPVKKTVNLIGLTSFRPMHALDPLKFQSPDSYLICLCPFVSFQSLTRLLFLFEFLFEESISKVGERFWSHIRWLDNFFLASSFLTTLYTNVFRHLMEDHVLRTVYKGHVTTCDVPCNS